MLSTEDASRIINDMREKYHIETFEDASDMCTELQLFSKACLVFAEKDGFDDVTKENLANLRNVMRLASKMFLNCDEYFR